jgi:hypothetical protein
LWSFNQAVVPVKSLLGVLLILVGLAGCDGKPPSAKTGGDRQAEDAGYLAPPSPDRVRVTAQGVSLSGSAPAGGRVRLASPAGQAVFADADNKGRWTIALGPVAEPRLFGLSVAAKRRTAQAEGYVLVTPSGQAALLRAGAGARRIGAAAKPGLQAIDFDRGGGVEVSATAPPGSNVLLHLDGRLATQGRADAAGRYDASLPTPGSSTPIRPGSHQVQVSGDGFSDTVTVQVSPAAPLAQGPARSQLTPAGLRVDWMTPGGGVQSTILVH